jgi:hypothetical protein
VSTAIEACKPSPNADINVSGTTTPCASNNWGTVGSAVSSSTVSYTDNEGNAWYCWQQSLVVPSGYWVPQTHPQNHCITQVRAVDAEYGFDYTYDNSYSQCSQPEGVSQITGAAPCAVNNGSNGIYLYTRTDAGIPPCG